MIDLVTVSQDQVRQIGQGTGLAWSPDDRFLSYRDYTSCGNTWCMGPQLLYPSAGGPSTVLTSQESSEQSDNQWVASPEGYGFDRWVLNRSGHIVRQILQRGDQRVIAWSPNGQFALIQGAQSGELDLVSASGKHTVVYVSSTPFSIHTTYTLAWAPDSTTFAFVVGASATFATSQVYLYTLPVGQSRAD